MQIKRRDFLKAGVAAGAAVALTSGLTLNAFAATKGKEKESISGSTDPGHWIASTCQGCTTWCPCGNFCPERQGGKSQG